MSRFKKTIKSGKATVKINLGSLEKIVKAGGVVDNSFRNELSEEVRDATLKLVDVGKSPVDGKGRFKSYAIQRKGRGYPEDPSTKARYPKKKTRPVNLDLGGEQKYLKSLFKWKPTKFGIEIGRPKDKFLSKLFDTHNQGKHKSVPQRKVIPTGQETFSGSILKAIKGVYLKKIKRILRS